MIKNNAKKSICCCIEKLAAIQHKSCAFRREKCQGKNKMIGLSLDNDYETIKTLCCLVKVKKAENEKGTRQLNATITQLSQHPDVKSDEI